jgi:hypothetical protein
MILEEMGVTNGVTPQVISILKQYPYRVLVRPIVKKMRQDGKTYEQIAIKLDITTRTVQWILSKGN